MKKMNHEFIALLFIFLLSQSLFAQFTPGNLVVVRVGRGDSALTNASTAVFLDEITPEGNPVRSIALPVDTSGLDLPVTLSGSASSEGWLTRSADGKFLVIAGYAAEPGMASVSGTTSAAVNRVIARIDFSGNINLTTRISGFFSKSNIRCAATDDGSHFWIAGNSSGANGAGIIYASSGDTNGIRILAVPNNTRCVGIFNGQLYANSGISGYTGIFTIGTGVPDSTGQIARQLPGFDTVDANPYAFSIDTTGTICYVADARSKANGGGVQKWELQDTIWILTKTFSDNLSTGVYGLAVDWADPHPKIYATTPSQIVGFTDSGGVPTAAVILDSASANTAFRGIALAPVSSQSGVGKNYIPERTCLLSNYPNPFNPSTKIKYFVGTQNIVSLLVYDILGREIITLVDGIQTHGEHIVEWDGKNSAGQSVGSGIYFYSLRRGGIIHTRKMLLLR